MSSEAKVGSFVLVGLGLLATAIFLLGDFTFEKRYALDVIFTDVSGLSQNVPVKLSGVEVGQVKAITLEGDKVKVVVAVREGTQIYKDSVFTVGITGIIGSKFMEITQGHPEAGIIPAGSTIAGVDFIPLDKAMNQALRSVEELLKQFNSPDPKAGTLASNLNHTVANMRDLTANLNDLIETSRPSLSKALARTDSISERLDDLLAKSNQVMASLSSDKGAVGALMNDPKVKEDVKETVSSIKEAAGTAKDMLGKMTQFKIYWNMDWRYEHVARASRLDVGLKISPRDGRYYYVGGANIGNENDARPSNKDYAKLNTIDALLGWEKGPFDVGVGVLRSGGGARVTVTPFYRHPVGQKFSLTAQAYDFSRDRISESRRFNHPVYDVGILARINRFFGIGARAEDLAEIKRYQTWANIMFEDKDLAYLFGVVSFGAAGTKGRSKK
ncbi:MAG: MlaD family protein [Elusimicrobiota bacterium]|jgi:phospholipid/cholesterol/gamma-HCH transport system substrate-binding protein